MRRLLTGALLTLVCAGALQAQAVLMEAPVVVTAPGYSGGVITWYDGSRFWIDPEGLLRDLGYRVTRLPGRLEAVDGSRSMTLDFEGETASVSSGPLQFIGPIARSPYDLPMVTMESLESVFDGDLTWDEENLSLQLSTSARLFDPSQLSTRRRLPSEGAAPLLFGRSRGWFSGAVLSYHATHTARAAAPHSFTARVDYAASMLGGALRGSISRHTRLVRYIYDFRSVPGLTRVEAGHLANGRAGLDAPDLGVRLSNGPLAPLRMHSDRMITGIGEAHALVRAEVGGQITDQAQADRLGRYSLRLPVYYGSTHATVTVDPLGPAPPRTTAYHTIVPDDVLPPKRLFYEVALGERGYGLVEYGLARRITLRASAGYDGLTLSRASASLAAMPLNTMRTSAEVNLIERSARARVSQWMPWGGFAAGWTTTGYARRYNALTAAGTVVLGKVSLRNTFSRVSFAEEVPTLSVRPSVTWQAPWDVRLDMTTLFRQTENIWDPAFWRGGTTKTVRSASGTWHLEAYVIGEARSIRGYGGSFRLSWRALDFFVEADLDLKGGGWAASGGLQLDSRYVWAYSTASRQQDDRYVSSGVRGTVALGRQVRFGARIHRVSGAVFRVFEDLDMDGRRSAEERTLYGVEMLVDAQPLRRNTDGTLYIHDLAEYETYTASIIPESIAEAAMVPATGYAFGFMAEPGVVRQIDIPMQPLPVVTGQVLLDTPGAYAFLEVVILQEGTEMERAPVFRDGGFIAQLIPGAYTFRAVSSLTGDVAAEADYWIAGPAVDVVLEE